MTTRDSALLEEIVEAAHEAHRERLIVVTSGNISARLESDDVIAISGTRTRLGTLKRDEIVAIGLDDAEPRPGLLGERENARPSSETPLHVTLYRRSPKVRAVLHFQSLAGTYYACRDAPMPNLNVIPELPVYIGKVAQTPFVAPNTFEIAEVAAEAFEDPDVHIVQLGNHGQVVIGDSPGQAVERAAFFELACRLCLMSETRGPLRPFTETELAVLSSYGKR